MNVFLIAFAQPETMWRSVGSAYEVMCDNHFLSTAQNQNPSQEYKMFIQAVALNFLLFFFKSTVSDVSIIYFFFCLDAKLYTWNLFLNCKPLTLLLSFKRL